MRGSFGVLLLLVALAALLVTAVSPAPAFAGELRTLHREDWFQLAALVVPVASFVANLTATDADNKAVGWFSKLVNLFALNFKRSGIK